MRAFVTLSTAVTSGNLAAGFLALLLATERSFVQTTALILLAAGFDSIDGPIARRASKEGAFGVTLDSLADLVSFGVTPALALYFGSLHEIPVAGLLACLGFLLCGAWRLARFPLVNHREYFVGLPVPPAGVLVTFLAASSASPILALLVVLLLSGLMVSEVHCPKLVTTRRLKKLFHKGAP